MRNLKVTSSYDPRQIKQQVKFIRSKAVFKAYGGAMGGGKTRTLCEIALHTALSYPGIEIIIARQEHTAIVLTTRKIFFREVLPPELRRFCRVIKSGGEDFCEFPNNSVIHFVGLDNPIKLHGGEFGMAIVDEAHEVDEDTVSTINSRLRQKCDVCRAAQAKNCDHFPQQMLFGFNPENPGHWLFRYFLADAEEIVPDSHYYTKHLRLDEDSDPIGDAEFFVAKATDNPFLTEGYVERKLKGMKPLQRQRYLEGKWLFMDGSCFFDQEILTEYRERTPEELYRFDFSPVGSIGDRARRRQHEQGRIHVYAEPVEGRAYAIGADVATGRGADYSVAYVVGLSDMEIAAEFRTKMDADLYAEQLHFLGRWYNTAWIAVELAGGWGEPVIISLHDGKAGRPAYPRLYRHIMGAALDNSPARRYGYPINNKTRPLVLNQLEQTLRERSVPYLTHHLIAECLTFCEFQEGTPSPRAQINCHDDCVMAAAIAFEMYHLYGHHPKRDERIAKRRRVRKRLTSYPWQRPVTA